MQFLSERLIQARKARGLNQQQLVESVGVSQRSIASWEAGENEPQGKSLRKLCDFLQVGVEYFFSSSTGTGAALKEPSSRSNEQFWQRRCNQAEAKLNELRMKLREALESSDPATPQPDFGSNREVNEAAAEILDEGMKKYPKSDKN